MGLPAPNQFKNERTDIQLFIYREHQLHLMAQQELADLYLFIGVLPNPVGPDLRELSATAIKTGR